MVLYARIQVSTAQLGVACVLWVARPLSILKRAEKSLEDWTKVEKEQGRKNEQ